MLSQLIATICGITLHTQVNACRITLQQATVDYNKKIEQKVDKYKREIENSEFVHDLKNEYTITAITLGKVVYEKQITFTNGNFGMSLKRDSASCTWRLTF